MPLPSRILNELQKIDPKAEFTGAVGGSVQSTNGKVYFVKMGSTSEEEQYKGEAESLKAIDSAAPRLAPKVFTAGVFEDGAPFFISEYKNIGHLTNKCATVLARRLATELHAYKSPNGFGFQVPTFCGATRMKNGWYDSWEKCYSEKIGDLLEKLRRRGGHKELCEKGESIRLNVIPRLLGPLKIEPVLLHGDLWSGNVGLVRETGEPVVFDPSSYFGHNEADLAIARIFGGFPSSFFNEYHSHFPKTEPVDQFDLRGDLYELFHYLNHTVLFGGGGYESSALRKIDILINAIVV